jgi:hypothetical protein
MWMHHAICAKKPMISVAISIEQTPSFAAMRRVHQSRRTRPTIQSPRPQSRSRHPTRRAKLGMFLDLFPSPRRTNPNRQHALTVPEAPLGETRRRRSQGIALSRT